MMFQVMETYSSNRLTVRKESIGDSRPNSNGKSALAFMEIKEL